MADQLQQMSASVPQEASQILQQLTDLARRGDQSLSAGGVAGILIALWSARKGMVALMTVTNVAYGEEQRKRCLSQLFISMAFTLGAVPGFLAVLLLAIVGQTGG